MGRHEPRGDRDRWAEVTPKGRNPGPCPAAEVAALAAYNAGVGNVDRWGGAAVGLGAIPFPETRAYVEDVLAKRGEYRDKYAHDLGL